LIHDLRHQRGRFSGTDNDAPSDRLLRQRRRHYTARIGRLHRRSEKVAQDAGFHLVL
jgi:hypothetical protein